MDTLRKSAIWFLSELIVVATPTSPACTPISPCNGKLPLTRCRFKLICSTWEGDNTILSLQAGRSLVGAWGGELHVNGVPSPLTLQPQSRARSSHLVSATSGSRASLPPNPTRPSLSTISPRHSTASLPMSSRRLRKSMSPSPNPAKPRRKQWRSARRVDLSLPSYIPTDTFTECSRRRLESWSRPMSARR